jgi:hypothetical protein
MHKFLRPALAAGMVALAAAVMFITLPALAAPADQPAPEPQDAPTGLYPSPNERIGVGVVYGIGDIINYDVTQLEAGWYSDWESRLNPPHPNGMEHVSMIPTRNDRYPPNWLVLAEHIRSSPGALWLVGNEQEAPLMENLTPAEYVVRYHDVYAFVKSVDPTAEVAIGGVIQPSPLRLQWLDMALQEYHTRYGAPMPVDVWNTHMQILNEQSCVYHPDSCWGAQIPAGVTASVGITMTFADNASYDLFVRLITDMRTWMNARGFRNKPLIISEYGVLMPPDYLGDNKEQADALVASFMTRTFEFMLNTVDPAIGYPADGNRLVQRWMWYSLNDRPYNMQTGEGFNGSLFDWNVKTYPGALTYFGQVFKDYVSPLKRNYVDVKPTGLTATEAGGVYTLTATVANIGNSVVSGVVVRLYAGNPAAGGVAVGSDAKIALLGIRYTPAGIATFIFTPPPERMSQTFYVVVDPEDAIAESDDSNNSASFFIRLREYTNRISLPVIMKDFQHVAQ